MIAQEIEYRDIPDFPGYRATSLGTIESCRTQGGGRGNFALSDHWKPCNPSPGKSGYLYLSLRVEGRSITRVVHRLICAAFHGPCPVGMQCCHGDGDKLNNSPNNLRWDSPQSNYADRDRHGTTQRADRHWKRKLRSADIAAIRALRASGVTQQQIADRYGVSRSTIGYIASGKIWKSI